MRNLAMMALCAALMGCAASLEEVATRLGAQYVGQNVDALVVKFGPPASTFKMNSGEARERFQGCRRTRRGSEFRSLDKFLIDLLLLGHPQAVRHLDHADAIDEGFVLFVGLEALPFGFVRMRENDTGEWNGPNILGTDVVAFLGRR